MIKTKEELLSSMGNFTWCWGMDFIIEAGNQIFIWKDPDYDGDNSIVEFNGDYDDAIASVGVEYGRDKGMRLIRNYCGDNVEVAFLGEKV